MEHVYVWTDARNKEIVLLCLCYLLQNKQVHRFTIDLFYLYEISQLVINLSLKKYSIYIKIFHSTSIICSTSPCFWRKDNSLECFEKWNAYTYTQRTHIFAILKRHSK
jgi:hypothetical protein